MELWVRSQERDKLEVCNNLSIQPIIQSNKKHSTWGIISNFGCIGEYETRDRCLEIIDEIQSLISFDKGVCSFTDKGGCKVVYEDEVHSVIYTMPKE